MTGEVGGLLRKVGGGRVGRASLQRGQGPHVDGSAAGAGKTDWGTLEVSPSTKDGELLKG